MAQQCVYTHAKDEHAMTILVSSETCSHVINKTTVVKGNSDRDEKLLLDATNFDVEGQRWRSNWRIFVTIPTIYLFLHGVRLAHVQTGRVKLLTTRCRWHDESLKTESG